MPGFFAPLAFAFSVIHMVAGDLEGYLSFLKVSVQKWPLSLCGYVLLAMLSYKATNQTPRRLQNTAMGKERTGCTECLPGYHIGGGVTRSHRGPRTLPRDADAVLYPHYTAFHFITDTPSICQNDIIAFLAGTDISGLLNLLSLC